MAKRSKQAKIVNRRIAIFVGGFVLIMLVAILIATSFNKKEDPAAERARLDSEYLEQKNQQTVIDLSKKSERERMQFYCADFFKKIDSGHYEEAYELLYSDYKENFFPNLANFTSYFKEYFPGDFSLSYNNIERLGDIYVLWVSVSDTVNGSKLGHNFNMNVVLKENALNDYVISFSRDSAVEEGGV